MSSYRIVRAAALRNRFRSDQQEAWVSPMMKQQTAVYAILSIFSALGLILPIDAMAAAQTILGRGGQTNVFIWKDKDSFTEGLALVRAGVHETKPEMVFRLVACIVPVGTKAIILDGGYPTNKVVVIDGPKAGCRGDAAAEDSPFPN